MFISAIGKSSMRGTKKLALIMLIGAILSGCATNSPSVVGSGSGQGVAAKATVAAVKF